MVHLVSATYLLQGDHMGQIAIEGIIGPSGKFPSRFTTTPKKELSNLNYPLVSRDPKATYLILTDALSKLRIHSQKTIASETLKNNGLLPKMSPLWNLQGFSENFFLRFALCDLHVALLGNFKKHLKYTIAKYSAKAIKGINETVKVFSKFPTMLRLSKVFVNKQSKGTNIQIYMVGEEMTTWLQVAIPCLARFFFFIKKSYNFSASWTLDENYQKEELNCQLIIYTAGKYT
jgi:hypothetical protein